MVRLLREGQVIGAGGECVEPLFPELIKLATGMLFHRLGLDFPGAFLTDLRNEFLNLEALLFMW